MNVAIVTSGILPVPPVKGGAVENLVKFYLDYNEMQNTDVEFTVYSVFDEGFSNNTYQEYKKTTFVFINTHTFFSKIRQLLFKYTKRNLYYHHSWEYFVSEVSNKIKHERFDAIVVENRPGFVLRLSKCSDAKLMLHLHNDMLNKDTKDASEILKLYTKVLTVSNYIKERVDTIMSTDKVQVVYNGIDLEKFKSPFHSEINRKNFHLSEDDFVVVYTGRIESVKGVKELLEAFSLLSDYEKIKLLIVGGGNGNINEGEFFSEMNELAFSMPEKVVFTGFQPYEKIPSILSFCDLAVVPSIWEDPFPTTVLESLAAGLPLIVTRSGGIPEAVNEECAIFVNIDNNLPLNLSNAILSIYSDNNKKNRMSEYAVKHSILFSKEKYALAILKLL
ncbi:glycosyltransferase family 4 protein [uncultured Bacteroides sp.]|uniref:glycosyltransferase family 4 protein n=1 Tax=uncultured Bacteroides sp. TaxID=162156 RepID=UPI002AABA0A7|nr:glycosyltransferase family 4 protein [uncultured Bacteroides sp.]